MPTFDSPTPIVAVIEAGNGRVQVNAGDRADTVVDVRPADPSSDADIRAARETVIDYSGGRLVVRSSGKRGRALFGFGGSIDVTVDLPAGSRLEATAGTGIRGAGRLGEARLWAAAGDIDVDEAGRFEAGTSSGDVSADHLAGPANVKTASGAIHIRALDGPAVVNTARGPITIGTAAADLRLATASGSISVDRASAGLIAKTATGDLRLGAAERGFVVMATGSGRVEIGVPGGTAARVDAHSRHGAVRTELTDVDGPAPTDETVRVHARSHRGDIVVRRS